MAFIRRLFFFILQFVVVSAAVTGVCAGVSLHTYGMQYRFTPEFAGKLHTYINFGLVAGALYCLVILCYLLTRRSLETRGDEPWNNTDNLG
ncbi:MAG: hypothetical protein QM647_00910 [Asticcacaulis sp.]|uniref:hypothetical protein n=1 Tax=Asticcacaulis sp. TaxID=1872648 RepID=UPI0039E30919